MARRRSDGRSAAALRRVRLTCGTLRFARASCLVEWGHTKVLCAATTQETVPPFLRNRGTGWITAEYGMLPRASAARIERERGRLGGRTQEIQRLIGRSLRAVVDLRALGERSILVDCDVLQADGGTRCASVTGGFVALVLALRELQKTLHWPRLPLRDFVAATSAGIVQGEPRLDLTYEEDAAADVDLNVVMTGRGALVEVQGTAERHPFRRRELDQLLTVAQRGIRTLLSLQRRALRMTS